MNLRRPKSLTQTLEMDGKTVSFAPNTWLLDVVLANGGDLAAVCGGMGTCGTCRVIVESGLEKLEERDEIEAEMADIRQYDACERLSCQTLARAGIKIRIP